MAFVKRIAGVLLAGVLVLIGVSYLLPSQVHIERAITIDAAPSAVFALISDFEAWSKWSPWAELDPDATLEISGSGMGQQIIWSSDSPQVGSGSQTIVQMDAPNYLQTHLDFGANGEADATFQLSPQGKQTQVIWMLDTDMRQSVPLVKQPLNAYLGLLMDAMVGQDYEAGLQNLKTLAES
ncbi:MAG: SRPBCC family protein [Leptolyngbyaceae cyanobacterium]